MVESNKKIYRELQESLDRLSVRYPATESGVELRILEHLFSPDKALITSKLSSNPKSLREICNDVEKDEISSDTVEKALDEMHNEGLILCITRKNNKQYINSPFILGFYEYQINKLTKQFVCDVDEYFEDYLKENNKMLIPQLRTIPIEQSIGIENNIATYNQLQALIEDLGEPFVVNECICRKKNQVIGKKCQKTDMKWSCLSFRSHGLAYINRGIGKIITKEKALDIIEKAQEEGLVIQPSNSQRPMAICFCCGCCCNFLVNQKKFNAPSRFFATNFFAQVNIEQCTGCGVCKTRCQMDAIEITDEKTIVDLTRCIGCGVCTSACPDGAITLIIKDETTIPPKNTKETYKFIAKSRNESLLKQDKKI